MTGSLRSLTLAWLVFATVALPQDETVFRSDVALVRVDAEVLDSAGAILANLKKEDFRLFDQGSEQPVLNFSFEQEPLDLILLFDQAGSMRGKLLRVVRAVELGFHELKTGDRACVMAFGSVTSEIAPFTPDFDAVNQAIVLKVLRLPFAGEPNPEQAAMDAARRFRREPKSPRRRAVLIIADKPGGSSPLSSDAVRELWLSNAVLGELVIGRSQETQIMERGANILADQTGGPTVVAGDPGASFQKALQLLRRRYTLFHALPAGGQHGSQRTLEVRLSADALRRFPGARIRARTGYVVP